MNNLQFFRSCFENELKATSETLLALPGDQLSYRPHPVNRSAGEIIEHILAHYHDFEVILHDAVCDEKLTYYFDSVRHANSELKTMQDRISKQLDGYSEDKWEKENVELLVNGKTLVTLPRNEMMWFFFFDVIHHRGQLSSYIRPMGGKNPAVYGYSADTIGL